MFAHAYVTLDRYRRAAGLALDRLGAGPIEHPWRTTASWAGARLRDYGGRSGGPPLLIVSAPFKRPYIWDLLPEVSAVGRFLEAGFRVFLIEWLPRPKAGAGLDDFALTLPEAACTAIEAAAGREQVILAGHSLGGTLAAIFASLRPERVAALALIDAPLAFGRRDGGPLATTVAAAPDLGTIAASFGDSVPGSAINAFSARAAPEAFLAQPARDAAAAAGSPLRSAIHRRVMRWTLDEYAMPARLFAEVGEALYRGDRFRAGGLPIGAASAHLGAVEAPIVAVLNPAGLIVPPASVIAGLRAAGGAPHHVLRYRAEPGPMIQHLGPLVGPNAHARLWPRILDGIADLAV
jgi:polyhydroxyalkanoate synthase